MKGGQDSSSVCIECGATILRQTANRNGGICQPCVKIRNENEIGATEFGRLYDRVFHAPSLRCEPYRDCWLVTELQITGPLFTSRIGKSIEYFFRRDSFFGMHSPSGFITWLNWQVDQLRARTRALSAQTPHEREDRDAILSKALELEQLGQAWLDFYVERHPQNER